jgi:hypothetical protein
MLYGSIILKIGINKSQYQLRGSPFVKTSGDGGENPAMFDAEGTKKTRDASLFGVV